MSSLNPPLHPAQPNRISRNKVLYSSIRTTPRRVDVWGLHAIRTKTCALIAVFSSVHVAPMENNGFCQERLLQCQADTSQTLMMVLMVTVVM